VLLVFGFITGCVGFALWVEHTFGLREEAKIENEFWALVSRLED
jgi:hypothetical protein